MTVVEQLLQDIGDLGISYDQPLPERGDMTEVQYRIVLQMDLETTKTKFFQSCIDYASRLDKRLGYWHRKELEALERRMWKLSGKVKVIQGQKEEISPEKIALAREFPLKDLVKNFRGMAQCPFHPDKRPSMDLRKNFYYCYGCGASGDAIDYVMKTENLTFAQAITRFT